MKTIRKLLTAGIAPTVVCLVALWPQSCKKEDAAACTSHASTLCESSVTYWVDSCGQREDVLEQCQCGCNGQSTACETCPDPCDGITCDQAPPPFCVDESTVRQYQAGGVCVDGRCEYDDYLDSPCTDCCYGAEINFTAEPLGGGVGYSAVVTPDQATVVVDSTDGFLSALAEARQGDVIYVDDSAVVDLTGHDEITVPAGVTVASGRGARRVPGRARVYHTDRPLTALSRRWSRGAFHRGQNLRP